MTIDILGVKVKEEDVEQVQDWLKDERGKVFWHLIDEQALKSSTMALAPPTAIVSYHVHIMNRERNAAKYEAYTSILEIEKEIESAANQIRENKQLK